MTGGPPPSAVATDSAVTAGGRPSWGLGGRAFVLRGVSAEVDGMGAMVWPFEPFTEDDADAAEAAPGVPVAVEASAGVCPEGFCCCSRCCCCCFGASGAVASAGAAGDAAVPAGDEASTAAADGAAEAVGLPPNAILSSCSSVGRRVVVGVAEAPTAAALCAAFPAPLVLSVDRGEAAASGMVTMKPEAANVNCPAASSAFPAAAAAVTSSGWGGNIAGGVAPPAASADGDGRARCCCCCGG